MGLATSRMNARAAWLRAKWGVERINRTIERLSKDPAQKDALKAAKAELKVRESAEKAARKAYDATK